MIGTDLNLTLPSTSDTYSAAIAKTATALQAIEDSIADKATVAALDILTDLDIDGNHLTNVGGLILTVGNTPTAEGSIYYSGGNFYAKDATSAIQLTANGAINLSAIGAIGGDYGTGPESFNYDLPSQEYRAAASSTLWADVVMDDLVLMEPGASPSEFVRITAQAMSASYTLTLPSAVPAAKNVLLMATDGTLAVPVADDSITLSGTGDYKHGEKTETAPFGWTAHTSTGSLSKSLSSSTVVWSLTAGGLTYMQFPKLRAGWRLKSVSVYGESASAASLSLDVRRLLVGASFGTTTNTGTFTGGSATCTLDTPYTVVEGDVLYVIVSAGASDVNSLSSVQVTYDIP